MIHFILPFGISLCKTELTYSRIQLNLIEFFF
nr:MAG TPA: hypothetical protein [Bacteriophage sp.]